MALNPTARLTNDHGDEVSEKRLAATVHVKRVYYTATATKRRQNLLPNCNRRRFQPKQSGFRQC